tara:strand:+ start:8637 stop:9524 length:888 start_codon:yes stop_codon:yes gene_type:complete
MEQILVTGSEGQVGVELKRLAEQRGINSIYANKEELDITQLARLERVVEEKQPSIIINAAAYTAVDKAEGEVDTAISVNKEGSANLAKVCKSANIPLLHISTDYVYDGKKDSPYFESDRPNPESIYGKSKWEGEEAIQKELQEHIILRTSWVFNSSGQSFPKTMLQLANERDTLNIVDDQFGSPTWAGDIAGVLLDIAIRHIQKQDINWGLYHYTGAPVTTWFGFAKTIIEQASQQGILKQMPTLNAISSNDYPTAAKRPKNSVLNCQKISRELGVMQTDWHVGLEKILTEWKLQ